MAYTRGSRKLGREDFLMGRIAKVRTPKLIEGDAKFRWLR
jgi:hypothetical protein